MPSDDVNSGGLSQCMGYARARFGSAVDLDLTNLDSDGYGSVRMTNKPGTAAIELFAANDSVSMFAGWLVLEPRDLIDLSILSAMDIVMTYGVVAVRRIFWANVNAGPSNQRVDALDRKVLRVWSPWSGDVVTRESLGSTIEGLSTANALDLHARLMPIPKT